MPQVPELFEASNCYFSEYVADPKKKFPFQIFSDSPETDLVKTE